MLKENPLMTLESTIEALERYFLANPEFALEHFPVQLKSILHIKSKQ